ncbi:MAG: hypothetical protein GX561_04575 [Lentisphaerae bacterium]|jgi:glycerophosphoryl diester phosphodiesterase|nr:hypothetical protein [Lentisphaerota bacterium]
MSSIRLQAHRGVSSEFPENTLAAFQASVDERYKIIELDPKFTVDDQCVILHDRTLNRTARDASGNKPEPDTRIDQITLQQAQQFEYGSWFDPKFKGEPIPTLDDVIQFIRKNTISFKFDNVWETFPPHRRELFLAQLEAASLGSKIGFTCRTLECLEIVAARFKDCELHWDGDNALEKLKAVAKTAKKHRLTIWLCYPCPMTNWFKGERASEQLAKTAHQFGEVGIWILSEESQLHDTINIFRADAIETTGHIKPFMLDKHTLP